jgi:beta-lactamase regulating signal transducer with metallopeptidase domain/Tol biopolymer transport system component
MLLNTLDGTGQWLVHTVGWLSLETLIFAAIVYAVTRWGGLRSSRVKRWLWTLVLVKPLVAVVLGWPLPLVAGPEHVVTPMATESASGTLRDSPTAAAASTGDATSSPSSLATLDHTIRRGVAPKLSGFAVLAMLWVAGAAVMAGYTILGAIWLWRARRQALPLTWDDVAHVSEGHAAALRMLLRRVDVRLTTRIDEPCVYGFFRPSILLPAWCLEDDAPSNLTYILLHEGAHCRARDHWFLWMRRAVETVLWFHPVVWLAGQRAMVEAENVCDEAVVALAEAEGTPSAALLYSACLMRVLERSTRHPFEGLVPGVIPTAERIRRLVQQRAGFGALPRRLAWAGVAAFAIVALPSVLTARSALATRALSSYVGREPAVLRDIVYSSKLPGDYFFNLYLVRSDGSGLMRLTDDRGDYSQPQWSPDGNLIAAKYRPSADIHWGVHVLSAAGQLLRRVSGPTETEDSPSWSPDGTLLACEFDRAESRNNSGDTHGNIYVRSVEGLSSRRLTDDAADYGRPAWSPQGRDIALLRREDGSTRWDLALIAADGTDLRVIPSGGPNGVHRSSPAWSPDGRRLAYLARAGGTKDPSELRILDLDTLESLVPGTTSVTGSDDIGHLAWSPDGEYIVLADRRVGDMRARLYKVSLATGETVALTPIIGLAKQPDVGPPSRSRAGAAAPRQADNVEGPVRRPGTGHAYFAVVAETRIDWMGARARARQMSHEGEQGYLAVVDSAEESAFLLAQFPHTHHGFWVGGQGELRKRSAMYTWSWENGEDWAYTRWHEGVEPPGSGIDPNVGVMTWSYAPWDPTYATSQTAYRWSARSVSSDEFGYIVEFDPPRVAVSP